MDWIIEKAQWLISYIESGAGQIIGEKVLELSPVFMVIALVGIYISMSGNKRLGTKLSSGSVLFYLALRVLFNA